MTEEQKVELQSIKDDSNSFSEKMIRRINDLCNTMDYHDGSLLSHKVDRLELYISELNEFEPRGN